MLKELDDAVVIGPKTNLAFLKALVRSAEFTAGTVDTGFIDANLGRLGAQPHPPDKRAVHAAALLLSARARTRRLAAGSVRSVAGLRLVRARGRAPDRP